MIQVDNIVKVKNPKLSFQKVFNKTNRIIMNTTENNKLIAKFLKFNLTTDGIQVLYYDKENHLKALPKFNSDWNWLMEVVQKIEATELNNIKYIDFHIIPDAVIVSNQEDEENPLILINKSECKGSIEKDFIMFETKMQAVYNACVEFIKWYNQQITVS